MSFMKTVCKLKDCCTIIAGQSPESKNYNTSGDGLPFFQGKADFGELYPNIRVFCSQPTKVAEKDDILLSVRAPVGPTNLAPCRVCIGRGLTAIRPSKNLMTRYVLLFFKYFEAQLAAKGTGTTFKAITQDVVKNLEIPVPSLEEQARIVARAAELFSELDTGVETLQKIKQQLSVYRQAVIEDAVMKANKEDEKKVLFQTVVTSYQNGISKRQGEGTLTPVLRLADIENQHISCNNGFREIGLSDSERKKYILNAGDLLIIRVNGSEENVGRAIVVSEQGMYSACDHFIRCILDKNAILPEFAQIALNSYSSRKHIKSNMVSTAGQNTVSQGTISSVMINLPSLEKQSVIVREVQNRLSICDNIERTVEQSLQQSAAMRQSILKQAFEGGL